MSRRLVKASTPVGSAAGNIPNINRVNNYYASDETRYQILKEEVRNCSLNFSFSNGIERTILTLAAGESPLPLDILNPTVGPNAIPAASPLASNSMSNAQEQLLAFVDQLAYPFVIIGYSQDLQSLYGDSAIAGNFSPLSFTGSTGIFNVRFVRIAPTVLSLGTWAGGAQTTEANNGNNALSSIIIRGLFLRFAPADPTPVLGPLPGVPDDVFLYPNGEYPEEFYLRLQKQTPAGKWVDVVPENAITSTIDQYGFVEYILEDLEPGTKYTAFITVLDPVFGASSSLQVRTADAIRTLYTAGLIDQTATDKVFFSLNQVNQQPSNLATFWTPVRRGECTSIHWMAGSCYAGNIESTLAGSDQIGHHYAFLVGDTYYQDNSRDGAFAENDFIRHYMSLSYVDSFWNMLRSKGSYALKDDHEIKDDATTVAILQPANAAQFQLVGAEQDMWNIILADAANQPYTTVLRPQTPKTQFSGYNIGTDIPYDRYITALNAFSSYFPDKPLNATPEGNFSVVWGRTKMIGLNIGPNVDADGNIQFYTRRSQLSPANVFSLITPPAGEPINQFIPHPAVEFLKQQLRTVRKANSGIDLTVVFFAKHLYDIFGSKVEQNGEILTIKDVIKNKYREMAQADPNYDEGIFESMFNKIYLGFGYDSSSPYDQIKDLFEWLDREGMSNVVFITGDPHVSYVKYINKERNILEVCTSSVGAPKTNGLVNIFNSNLQSDETVLSISSNVYTDFEYDPFEGDRGALKIKYLHGDETRGQAAKHLIVPLVKPIDITNVNHC